MEPGKVLTKTTYGIRDCCVSINRLAGWTCQVLVESNLLVGLGMRGFGRILKLDMRFCVAIRRNHCLVGGIFHDRVEAVGLEALAHGVRVRTGCEGANLDV